MEPSFDQFYKKKMDNRDPSEMIEQFIFMRKNKNNPLINSTNSALVDCFSSISTNDNSFMRSVISDNSNYKKKKSFSITQKFSNYTKELQNDLGRKQKIENLNKKMINNVNVLNIRYIDTGSNNYFLACRPRFNKVIDYNRKAQDLYKMDLSPNTGCWSVNVSRKVFDYRNDLLNQK